MVRRSRALTVSSLPEGDRLVRGRGAGALEPLQAPDTRGAPTRRPRGHRHQLHQEQSVNKPRMIRKGCSC